jgi:hypothetical protein
MSKELHRLFAACAIALAAWSCSPEAGAPAPGNGQAAEPGRPVAQRPPGKNEAVAGSATATAQIGPRPAAAGVRRCGWLHNPTPANWWLVDRDGQWVLGSQGGHQAPGMDELPDMSAGEWVEINGHYGYGCACMNIAADPATGQVSQISAAKPKPLAQCRADKQLPNPDAG